PDQLAFVLSPAPNVKIGRATLQTEGRMDIRYSCATAPTSWGNFATIAGAIAGFLVVVVALIPVFREWSAQKKRASVSAAQLYVPFEQVYAILKKARDDFDVYARAQRLAPNTKSERLV